MAKLTEQDRRSIREYVAIVSGLSRQMRESMTRVESMLLEIETHLVDPEWRETLIAEARSWRQSIDAMPTDPPELAKGVQIRVLRWFGLAAETGDDLAAGIDGPDVERMALVGPKMAEVRALADAATRSGKMLAERVQQAR